MWQIAILLSSFLIQVIDLVHDYHEEKKNKVLYIFKILVAGCVAFLAGTEAYNQSQWSKINSLTGKFGDQKDCFSPKPIVMLGGNKYENNKAIIVFQADSEWGRFDVNPVQDWCAEDQIHMNVTIRNSIGDEIGNIKGRDWEITDRAGIDYNNDDSAFEIISANKVVFQMQIKRDTIIVKGMVATAVGYPIYFDNNGHRSLPPFGGMQRYLIPEGVSVSKIFKYPRRNNLGERNSE